MSVRLKCPWPAFGGKSRVANMVWTYLGDVSNYIEPFANSAAVLLARPHEPKIETINDLDCYCANAWRALSRDPEAVAGAADWPVNEADLHARHRWLVLSDAAAEFRRKMRTDPDYFDAKVAGWWIWGACCWIGSGWCATPESANWEQVPYVDEGAGRGVNAAAGLMAKRPKLSGGSPDSGALGTGAHANGPDVPHERPRAHRAAGSSNSPCNLPGVLAGDIPTDRVPGLREKMPRAEQCQTGGFGVHGVGPSDAHRPQLADQYARGRGVHGNDSAGTCAARRAWLVDWFGGLRDRLRTVRVCCGDWTRVCTSHSVTTRLGLTGVFLDAPYKTTLADGTANRSGDLYANDRSQDVNALVDDVIRYCLERGDDPQMRIVACCLEGEGYEVLAGHGWQCIPWKGSGGYGNRSEVGKANAARERLWVSPHCITSTEADLPLFAGKDA